ncbi:MAG: M16 family metallopeptidase [Terriglobales bacterium]
MRFRLCALLVAFAAMVPGAAAQNAVPPIPFTAFKLKNGLRVVLSEDHSLPVVTESMLFAAGSAQAPHRTGLLADYGGVRHASTREDYTFDSASAPSSALPIVMWLDADRLSAPRNCVLTIVGDFNTAAIKAQVRKDFGWIPNRRVMPGRIAGDKPQPQPRPRKFPHPFAKLPSLTMAWQGPPRGSRAYYALTLLGQLLFSGRGSRLYQSLVNDHQLAVEVAGGLGFPNASFRDYSAPGRFAGLVVYRPGASAQEIEALAFQQIYRIEANGISPQTMQRLKIKFSSGWIRYEQTTLGRNRMLALATFFDGKPEDANSALRQFLDLDSNDIAQAARTYLTSARLNLIRHQPGAVSPSKRAPAQRNVRAPAYMDHPPQALALAPYTPPASQVDQLPNGLRIVVVQDSRFPLVTVRFGIRAGQSRLTNADAALAQAEADLLPAGTSSRSSLQIFQQLGAMGGGLSTTSGPDFLTLSAYALSNRARSLIALVSDVVFHPSFPPAEVALEKANLLLTLRARRAQPAFLASVQFHRLLFGVNPYAIIAPTPASIARLSRKALQQFHQLYFLPNNQAEVVVVGDIPAARAHNLVQQYFGGWRLGMIQPPPSPPVTPPQQPRIYLVERPGSARSTILLGHLGLARSAPDHFAFQLVNQALGADGVVSANTAGRDLGVWTVSARVPAADTAAAVKQILAQLERIRNVPLDAQQLRRAKNQLSARFLLGLQTQAQLADALLLPGLYGVSRNWLSNYVRNVQSATAAQALAAARSTIHPRHLIIVVVGDVKNIEAGLANLTPGAMLTIFNASGKLVGTYPPEAPPKLRRPHRILEQAAHRRFPTIS